MANNKEKITFYFIDKNFGRATAIWSYLEQLNKKTFEPWVEHGFWSLEKAGINKEDVRIVVLVNGTARFFTPKTIKKSNLWRILKKSVKK